MAHYMYDAPWPYGELLALQPGSLCVKCRSDSLSPSCLMDSTAVCCRQHHSQAGHTQTLGAHIKVHHLHGNCEFFPMLFQQLYCAFPTAYHGLPCVFNMLLLYLSGLYNARDHKLQWIAKPGSHCWASLISIPAIKTCDSSYTSWSPGYGPESSLCTCLPACLCWCRSV